MIRPFGGEWQSAQFANVHRIRIENWIPNTNNHQRNDVDYTETIAILPV